jgi:hypothetical protein
LASGIIYKGDLGRARVGLPEYRVIVGYEHLHG